MEREERGTRNAGKHDRTSGISNTLRALCAEKLSSRLEIESENLD